MIVKFGFLLFFLFHTSAFAALQYLVRYDVAESTFDAVNTNFVDDYHTSGAAYDDSVDRDVPLGFNFSFNGTIYTTVNIDSNGILYFGNYDLTEYSNNTLPRNNRAQSIYPYWDDLNMGSYNGQQGEVSYDTLGSAPHRRFVVHWDGVPHYSNTGSYSFQVVLYEDGAIRFRYDAASDANGNSNGGATIGVQEDTGHYDQYAYNTAIDQSRDVLYVPIDNDYSDWHFDELSWNGSANEIVDSHSTHHGTGHSVSPVTGKICNAIDLTSNSTTDYATLGAGALDGVRDFTVSVWHKGVAGTDSNGLLSGANVPQYNEFIFWFTSPTRFNGYLNDGSKGSVNLASINDDTWQHFVWRRAGEDLCFFVNGSLEGCSSGKEQTILDISSLILGQEQDSLGGGFDRNQDWEGLVDELLIFRRALSNSEISTGFNNQNNGNNWDGSVRTCPGIPIMNITKDSCVINDPVNNGTNPKRIPGATIRYAIEVSNTGTGVADDAMVDDNISNDFDLATITNLRIDGSHTCNCISPISAGANGANGGINGNNVKLDFDTVDAGTTECGYFEVDIR